MSLAFVDIETTGLHPDYHQIWEVALIIGGRSVSWQLPVDLGRADPIALDIGRFHERRWPLDRQISLPAFAERFADLTRDHHLVGAVVSFDEERLRRLLRREHQCPTWHYHLVDVEALAAGKLGQSPPWKSNELSLAVGVDPEDYERHTALGDAKWARAIYDAVMA